MTNPYMHETLEKLRYKREKSPVDNISSFYSAVKIIRYEWVEVKLKPKCSYYLVSAWKNEVDLRDITIKFYQSFSDHLVDLSMDESVSENHEILLLNCKRALRKAIHYFNISFTDILVLTRPDNLKKIPLIVHYESLPDNYKESITRCYDLIVVLFRELERCVDNELKEYERKQYVQEKSNYNWKGDKNDLSELALAIYASGKVTRKGPLKMKPSTFARELAAFFNVDKLNYDQDIDLIGTRQRRQPGEFIDKCKASLLKYFDEKYKKK